MPAEALVQFLGVNLRKERLSLRDEDVARAINADLHSIVGAATVRKGRQLLFTLAGTVRYLSQLNGVRYAIADTTLYADGVSLITGLHAGRKNTLLAQRPLNDPTTWAFLADRTAMKKITGSTVRTWGIAAPTTTPTVATGVAGSLSGVYGVRYTYVRKDGSSICHESNPSPASGTATLSSQVLNVDLMAASTDAQVTHKRIYRTVNSGSTYLFDSEVTNATVATTLTRADTALGAAVETDNDVPPASPWATLHQEHAFFLDPAHPSYLWWSKRYRPESVPAANYIDIGTATDALNGLVSLVGLLGVFTRNTKYRVLGNATSGFVHQEALSSRGTPAPQAALVTEHGCLFPARDGLFLTNFVQPDQELSQLIAPLFEGETVNEYAPINWAAASAMATASYKQRLYFAYPSGDNTIPDMLAVYSFHTQQWYFYQMRCSTLYYEEVNDYLLAGTDGGEVYALESSTSDGGAGITMTLEPATRSFQDPFILKAFEYLRVDADLPSGAMTCRLYIDGSLVRTLTITGSRTRRLVRLNGTQGYTWRVVLTYTGAGGSVAVHGVEVQARPLGKA